MTRVPQPRPEIRAGHEAADRSVAAQADAGSDVDTIARNQDDAVARLASEADTAKGRAYAGAYAFTASALVNDLRDLDRQPPHMVPGTPHPDPFLAAHGWEVGKHGIYTRTGHRQTGRDLEAG
jgi:hypothetical protein